LALFQPCLGRNNGCQAFLPALDLDGDVQVWLVLLCLIGIGGLFTGVVICALSSTSAACMRL
jgi:hypothetical protein